MTVALQEDKIIDWLPGRPIKGHPDGDRQQFRSRRHLLDEPLRQCLGQYRDGDFLFLAEAERTARKLYRTRDEAKADVFDYIERFYNPKRRHSTIGYLSPMEFESQVGLA